MTSTSKDLAVPDMTADLERSADPARFLVQACERAKSWLKEALEHGEIDAIFELKSQAEAIRVYTMSKQLGHDAELTAGEIVRRAEHGLALAVRKGQQSGEIRKAGDPPPPPTRPYTRTRQGKTETVSPPRQPAVPAGDARSPRQFFTSRHEMTDVYVMAEASDEQFEDALGRAKAEENLSRANVVRKVKEIRESESPPQPPQVAKKKPGRRAFPDAFRDASDDALKAVEKLVRLVDEDDRFAEYAQQVADTNRHQINRARDLLVDVASRIPGLEKEIM